LVGGSSDKKVVSKETSSAGSDYRSELDNFRFYRLRKSDPGVLSSLMHSPTIDPSKIFCRFELAGVCNDPDCPDIHMRQLRPTLRELKDGAFAPAPHRRPAAATADQPALGLSLQALLADDPPSTGLPGSILEDFGESVEDLVQAEVEPQAQLGHRHFFLFQGMNLDKPKEVRYYDLAVDPEHYEVLVEQNPQDVEAWINYAIHMLPNERFLPSHDLQEDEISGIDVTLSILSTALTVRFFFFHDCCFFFSMPLIIAFLYLLFFHRKTSLASLCGFCIWSSFSSVGSRQTFAKCLSRP